MSEQEHPIESLMKTAMESIKDMVDVDTVIGKPVETPDGNVIIPISRVTTGFAAGGSEYENPTETDGKENESSESGVAYPFGGGSGAGVSVRPVGFLVSTGKDVRLLPVDRHAIFDHLIDSAPRLICQLKDIINGKDNSLAKPYDGDDNSKYCPYSNDTHNKYRS